MTQPGKTGKLEFPKHGILIEFDQDGWTIKVVDYHAEEVYIPWADIFQTAREAGIDLQSLPGKTA
jgi:hypothetical protein